jgi:hypothetical protein
MALDISGIIDSADIGPPADAFLLVQPRDLL